MNGWMNVALMSLRSSLMSDAIGFASCLASWLAWSSSAAAGRFGTIARKQRLNNVVDAVFMECDLVVEASSGGRALEIGSSPARVRIVAGDLFRQIGGLRPKV